MLIRKQFKFEAAHRVRSSTGSRCKNSIHGHSYLAEVFLEGDDSYDMVMDFGTLKKEIGEFMDSLDHATFIWKDDEMGYIDFIRKYSKRVVFMYCDPTAENMAKAIMKQVDFLLAQYSWVAVSAVRIHETATGYAEATGWSDKNDIIELEHNNDD